MLTAAALVAAGLLSPAAADESSQRIAPAVAADTDGATARGGAPSPARVAEETIAPADDAGVGYAKTPVRRPAPDRKRATGHPANRVAWVESIRPIKNILFLGVGF
jgi:hypothetical protein